MKGSVLDAQDGTGRTGLHQAARGGDIEEVELLLSGGANPNTQDAHMQTPVTLAAERGLEGVVRALAEHAATDINLQDSFGRTPLHWCAKRCDVGVMEILLETDRANVFVRTTGGDTALHWACSGDGGDASGIENIEERSSRVVELLLAAGADVRARNDLGETPRDVATSDAIVALLMSASHDIQKREEEEEAEAERIRVLAAQRSAFAREDGGKPAKASPMGVALPAKQSDTASRPFKQQKGAKEVTAGVTKKKIVIKLKKKP